MADLARQTAYNAVIKVFAGGYSNLCQNEINSLEPLDRAFATNLFLGVISRSITLDYLISHYVNRDLDVKASALIKCGLYQILYMSRVPDSAACNETVTLAGAVHPQCGGFVNAILRRAVREKEEAYALIENAKPHIRYSVSEGIYNLLNEQYKDDTEKICNSFFEKAPLFLRVNTQKISALELAEKYGGEYISEKSVSIAKLGQAADGIKTGEFFIQGLASQKACELLNAQPGQTLFDVCAAPGGKSLYCGLDMQSKGRVFSSDIHSSKLSLIKKSAAILRLSNIQTFVRDARVVDEKNKGIADRVICDVPCSGLGVIAQKPEIRYKDPKDFTNLYKTQADILKASAELLKTDGVLLYSTCTLNKLENENTVHAFLQSDKRFELITEQTFMPYDAEREGFYAALIKKARD